MPSSSSLFVIELLIRLVGHGRELRTFFRSGWNLFDLGVVLLSLVPAVGPLATVARLARVLRVTRLLSLFPRLRLIVATMVHSIHRMSGARPRALCRTPPQAIDGA